METTSGGVRPRTGPFDGAGRLADYWWTVYLRTWKGSVISSFVVPILVGGFKVHVLPMVVYDQVLSVFDWPFGAANAFVLAKQFQISVEQNTASVLLSTAFSVVTVSALLVWLRVS